MCDSQGSTASRRYRFVTESRGKPLFEPYTTCVTDRSRWGWPQKRTRLAAQRPQCAAAASTPVIFSWKSLDKKTCQIISSQNTVHQCHSYLTNFYVSLMKKPNFSRLYHLTEKKSSIRLYLCQKLFSREKVGSTFDSLLLNKKTSQISVMQWSDEFFCCLH